MARDTREVWEKRVERLADSGLTAKEFAAEIGVNENTLAGWRWRLGRSERLRGPARLGIVAAPEDESEERAPAVRERTQEVTTVPGTEAIAPMRFVELTTKTAAAPTQVAPFEIVLGSGRLVRVPGGFDAAELARLVGVLEGVRS